MNIKNIAEEIHLNYWKKLKECLDDLEEIYGDRENERYQYLRKKIMGLIFSHARYEFYLMEEAGLVERCSCGSDVKHGYRSECDICHGAGWTHTRDFDDFLEGK